MKRVSSIIAGVIAAVASVTYANAASLVVSGGELIGAEGVDVNGTLYDVQFVDGTCEEAFGSCEVSAFDFDNEDAANDAAQALLDQVFLDGSDGLFDSDPALTAGCNSLDPLRCFAMIPYDFDSNTNNFFYVAASNVNDLDSLSSLAILGFLDFATFNQFTFANFSLSSTTVPIPGAIPFMLTGLIGVGWMKRRKKEA